MKHDAPVRSRTGKPVKGAVIRALLIFLNSLIFGCSYGGSDKSIGTA